MKRIYAAWKTMATVILTILSLALLLGQPALAAQDHWPMRFERPKATVIMYQPQVEDMKDDKITAYAAVSVQKKESKQPVYGAVWLAGRVETNRDTRMATIDEVKITDAKFPEATSEELEKLKTVLNEEFQDWSTTISLDRLLADLAMVEKERAADAGLKNEPPKVIFKSQPAVLVLLDSEPKLLPIPDSKLMRVANTPFIMVYDPAAKTYYLKGGDTWLSATKVTGDWKNVDPLPEPLQALAKKMQEANAKMAGAAGQKPTKKEIERVGNEMPQVIVSTGPAELLVTDGDPQYTPIAGTSLLFVSNTESNIFMDTGSQEYYTLLSGRWFKSKSLKDGPWAYVAPDKLPADFAKIPPESTKGFVLVNVANTQQAKEAVMDNHIPQTAAIDRKRATTEVKYAGDPKFDKIPNTNLEYAVNTGKTVFKEGTKYYAVDQGVWYEADSPNGPWKVCVNPPQDVNKIPPSNPTYNAKYVKVYDSSDDTAYVGYTPGYTGSYVDDGTVVYGTGYDYPAYSSGDTYIPPAMPATYGYAATYDPYAATWGYQPSYYYPFNWLVPGLVGFGLGYATGAVASNWWNRGWYGGAWYGGGGWWGTGGYHYNNVNINHNYVYHRNWNSGNRWSGYRPGERPGGRPRPTPYAGHRPNIYNRPGNQNLLASRPSRPATRPTAGVRPERPAARPETRPAARPGTRPGQAVTGRPQQRPAGGKNNVFADHSGNVYRREAKGNWQQRQGGQWQAARTGGARPAATHRDSFQPSQLNRDFQARERGQLRTQNFQRASAGARFGGGGGGFRGGGGGGFHGGGGRGGRR